MRSAEGPCSFSPESYFNILRYRTGAREIHRDLPHLPPRGDILCMSQHQSDIIRPMKTGFQATELLRIRDA